MQTFKQFLSESNLDWARLSTETQKKLNELFGENVKFGGGYCFHLALALFLQAKKAGVNVTIIADNGHAAVYDVSKDVSVDYKGVHNGESALNEPAVKQWRTAAGLIKAVATGWSTKEQLERLEIVKKEYE